MTFAVRNYADAVRVALDLWVNHRIVMVGPDGKQVARTEAGEGARERFGSGDRDRNESVDLAPGDWDEQLSSVDLAEHFRMTAPGRYELRVEYSDLCGKENLSVVSAALVITVVETSFAKFQSLAEALIAAVEDGEDGVAKAILGEKGAGEIDRIRQVKYTAAGSRRVGDPRATRRRWAGMTATRIWMTG